MHWELKGFCCPMQGRPSALSAVKFPFARAPLRSAGNVQKSLKKFTTKNNKTRGSLINIMSRKFIQSDVHFEIYFFHRRIYTYNLHPVSAAAKEIGSRRGRRVIFLQQSVGSTHRDSFVLPLTLNRCASRPCCAISHSAARASNFPLFPGNSSLHPWLALGDEFTQPQKDWAQI